MILALFWWSKSMNTVNEVPPTRDFPVPTINETSEFDQVKGATSTAKVTIIEYSDFQCPACRAYHPMVKELLAANPEVKFIYRHFPLGQHFNAKKAAIAAEAAGLQGKFWEMHDILFEEQDDWAPMVNPNRKFIGYAESLGLDAAKFEQDLSSGDLRLKVDQDMASGHPNGVNSTPTFFVNGVKVASPKNLEAFQALLTK